MTLMTSCELCGNYAKWFLLDHPQPESDMEIQLHFLPARTVEIIWISYCDTIHIHMKRANKQKLISFGQNLSGYGISQIGDTHVVYYFILYIKYKIYAQCIFLYQLQITRRRKEIYLTFIWSHCWNILNHPHQRLIVLTIPCSFYFVHKFHIPRIEACLSLNMQL